MPNSRELLTFAELSGWLTAELQKAEDAAGSSIAVQYVLQEPDQDGCNWSDSVNLRVGPSASKEALAPYVARLIHDARARFNAKS